MSTNRSNSPIYILAIYGFFKSEFKADSKYVFLEKTNKIRQISERACSNKNDFVYKLTQFNKKNLKTLF